MADQPDRVPDREFVYRRIPWVWYSDPRSTPYPQIDAFLPRKDSDGLSVYLASLTKIDAVRMGRSANPYHVARLNVGRLRHEVGLNVVADPILPSDPLGRPPNPAHALIPALNQAAYEANKTAMKAIAERISREIAEFVLVVIDPVLAQSDEA